MEYQTLLVEKTPPLVTVTFNRPARLNAFNLEMIQEVMRLCSELREDVDTRCVIFTGAGRAFSAGIDLSGRGGPPPEDPFPHYTEARMGQLLGHDFMRALEGLEQITIAAVNGLALGGAFSVCMACDFRIASENAGFGIPEANVGLFFTWGCTPRLVSLIGPAKAKELIMTCDIIDAAEAQAIGFVNKVVPAERLMETARELAAKIISRSPLAIRLTKKIANAAAAPNIGDLYICEPELVERLYLSGDPAEGANAFLEKKKPRFTGR